MGYTKIDAVQDALKYFSLGKSIDQPHPFDKCVLEDVSIIRALGNTFFFLLQGKLVIKVC